MNNKVDLFEKWMETDDGKGCMEPSILKNPDQAKYLRNRLWHAFHANPQKESSVEEIDLLQEVLKIPKGRVPKWLIRKIEETIKTRKR